MCLCLVCAFVCVCMTCVCLCVIYICFVCVCMRREHEIVNETNAQTNGSGYIFVLFSREIAMCVSLIRIIF